MSVATISPNLEPLESATPAFDVITTTNLKGSVWKFDSTAQEYLNGKFEVPPDIDTSGTVKFRAKGIAATGATANVAFDFDHAAVAANEGLGSFSYTTEPSGDKACDPTTNDWEVHEWTETVSNLGWAAGDEVFFRISKEQASTGNLTGDWYLYEFTIEIPLA